MNEQRWCQGCNKSTSGCWFWQGSRGRAARSAPAFQLCAALGGAVPTRGGEEAGKAALASCRLPTPAASSLLERAAMRERGMRSRGARCLRALAASPRPPSPPLVWAACGKGRCCARSSCSCVCRGTGGEVKEPAVPSGTLGWFNLHSVTPFFFFDSYV